jgi:tripartite-type tricarboxylate transporter receptor subunit TctC
MMLARLLAAAVAAISFAQVAVAAYPEKPVRIVVAYAPGGAVDVVARRLAQKLTEQTGQTFIVENKPGATGLIGTQQVVRSPADGYTLLAIDNTYSILPYAFKKLPWNHEQDLVPITVSIFTPVMLVVRADSKYKDLPTLLADARANPEKLTYGTGGAGSAPHFASEAFQQTAGVKLTHVPYKGAGDAVTGLVSGQIDMLLLSTPSVASQIKGGKARALAVTGKKRLAAFPTVPTFDEAGVAGYGVVNWSGLAAPKGTPGDVIARLHAEVKKALASADMQEFVAGMSGEPGGVDPAGFTRLIRDETGRWSGVAQKANIERQ